MSSFSVSRFKRMPIKVESDLDDVAPGSLLEIHHGTYTHWAVYLGDRKVCHLTVIVDGGNGSFTESMAALSNKDGCIVVQLFKEMMGGEDLSVYVNNSSDSKWTPLPPEQIVQKAISQVSGNVPYDVVNFNCEHFANECRYGIKASLQVKSAANTARVTTVIAGVAAVAVAFGKLVVSMK